MGMALLDFFRSLLTPYHAQRWLQRGLQWTITDVPHLAALGLATHTELQGRIRVDPFSFAQHLPLEPYLDHVFTGLVQRHSLLHPDGVIHLQEFARMPVGGVWAFFGNELSQLQSPVHSGTVHYLQHLIAECGNITAMEYVPSKLWRHWTETISAENMPNIHPQSVDWLIERGYLDPEKRMFTPSAFRTDNRISFLVPPDLMVSADYVRDIATRWLRDYTMDAPQKVGLVLTLLRVYGEDHYRQHLADSLASYLQDIDLSVVYKLHQACSVNCKFEDVAPSVLHKMHPALPAMGSLSPPTDLVDVYLLYQYLEHPAQEMETIPYANIPMTA